MNVGATFQRAIDIAFAKEIHDFLVVYQVDITMFSKFVNEHLDHLRRVFIKCRKFWISLNPKMTLFGLEEGKLLGHIISKYGIRIDPTRIEAILTITHPRKVRELQSFLGKISFLRRFISNLVELIRELNYMLRKDSTLKWRVEAKKSIESIKEALTKTPIIISHNFNKDFIIFYFASEHNQGYEQPITFFSKSLRYATLKYNIMEKQALALVKAIKDFRVYIMYSHIIAYIPNSVVKDILCQNGPEGKRGKWISTILEYDIEINPTKLIKGKGLAELMAESNYHALDINFISALDDQEEMETPPISEHFTDSP